MSSRENAPIEIELMPQAFPSSGIETTPEADDHARELTERGQEFSLPEADGGKQAWRFLAGCFVVEAMVWGTFLFIRYRDVFGY